MIKIIQKGTRSVLTCPDCGCVFSYEKEDIVYTDTDNYKAFRATVVCPQCVGNIIISQAI